MTTLNIFDLPERQSHFASPVSNKRMALRRLASLTCLVACIVLAATPVNAQQPEKIVPGSAISLSSVAQAQWVQGEAPTSLDPDKVYIFECWSTKCGPCIAMIPHVNDLHKKYYDQGLRIYGMSVYENDISKVEEFVKEKGDGMSYPVAFTGKGGAFETEFFKPAGGKGIPQAFIVRNGKFLVSARASRLTETLIESILSGDEGAKKSAVTILAEQKHEAEIDALVASFRTARSKKDSQEMTVHIESLKGIEPDFPNIPPMELEVLIFDKKWDAAVTALNALPANDARDSFVSMNGMRTARNNNPLGYSDEFMTAMVKQYSTYIFDREYPVGPNHYACLSILQWGVGDKEAAKVTAEKGAENATTYYGASPSRTEAFNQFLKSVNEGSMPSLKDLSKWQRDSRERIAAEKESAMDKK